MIARKYTYLVLIVTRQVSRETRSHLANDAEDLNMSTRCWNVKKLRIALEDRDVTKPTRRTQRKSKAELRRCSGDENPEQTRILNVLPRREIRLLAVGGALYMHRGEVES